MEDLKFHLDFLSILFFLIFFYLHFLSFFFEFLLIEDLFQKDIYFYIFLKIQNLY